MAGKDLRQSQLDETSFIEGHDQQYHIIEVFEADHLSARAPQQSSTLTAPAEPISGHQRFNPAAGIIMRIGRGVKSAVGGAVNKLTGRFSLHDSFVCSIASYASVLNKNR